jgi:hypothetical protein
MTRRQRAALLRARADPPRDPLSMALEAYGAAFGDTPTVMGVGAAYYPALAAVLRQAVTDAELRRRLGMTMPPPGAMI